MVRGLGERPRGRLQADVPGPEVESDAAERGRYQAPDFKVEAEPGGGISKAFWVVVGVHSLPSFFCSFVLP